MEQVSPCVESVLGAALGLGGVDAYVNTDPSGGGVLLDAAAAVGDSGRGHNLFA